MRFDTRSTRVPLLALALAIGAAACAKKDATTDEVAGGTVDTSAVTTPAFKVADVNLGRSIDVDKKIKDGTKEFGVRDTIYASVKTEGSATGANLTARWTFQDGQIVEEQTQTVNATGDAVTEFHMTKATPWPKGTYKLTILLNGAPVETEDFEVK